MKILLAEDNCALAGRHSDIYTMFSAAMIEPERVSFMWKVLVRMSGMTLSYICQKAQMDKNARPVKMVRRLLSFMCSLLIRNVVFSNMSIIAALR